MPTIPARCRCVPPALALADAVEAFYAQLDEVTLDALVCDNTALFSIFSVAPARNSLESGYTRLT